jgi:antitoxin (DNA-binding transcriptional repressor) of toxin-antitoxin stability system
MVGIVEAKTHFSSLIQAVIGGETIIVTKKVYRLPGSSR